MSAALERLPEVNAGPGAINFVRKPEPIVAGTFTPKDTIAELLAAATAIERIGYEPKIKFAGNGDDPSYIELIVDDVADMMTTLRASLTSTNHKEGREG